jgi:transposase-like protein
MRRGPVVLKELGLVEQRYQAVREVLTAGASVTDVARRIGISHKTVHEWLVKYANQGLVGLMDRSSKPLSRPHQMSPVVEARIIELRREHPGWGPRTLVHRLEIEGFDPVPARTSIEVTEPVYPLEVTEPDYVASGPAAARGMRT